MDGKQRGSFWNLSAAMIGAIGTLLAALVALAAFLVQQDVFHLRGTGGDPVSPPGSTGEKKLDDTVVARETFGADGTSSFEFDGATIVRNPQNDPDFYLYANISTAGARDSVALWTEETRPTFAQCADRVRRFGVGSLDNIDKDSVFCVRTSGGRTAMVAMIADGSELEVTVWKQKT